MLFKNCELQRQSIDESIDRSMNQSISLCERCLGSAGTYLKHRLHLVGHRTWGWKPRGHSGSPFAEGIMWCITLWRHTSSGIDFDTHELTIGTKHNKNKRSGISPAHQSNPLIDNKKIIIVIITIARIIIWNLYCDIWGSHSGEDDSVVTLGWDGRLVSRYQRFGEIYLRPWRTTLSSWHLYYQ
jgi:hypothetical protein